METKSEAGYSSYGYDAEEGDNAYVDCSSLGTFVLGVGAAMLVLLAVIGLVLHGTRYTDVYTWTTVSDATLYQSAYTIQWFLRVEGDHHYLALKSDVQELGTGPVFNSDFAFPLKHLPVDLVDNSIGTVHEIQMATGGLSYGNTASLLLLPTGQSVISARLVVQDVGAPAGYGALLDIALFNGFQNHPFVGYDQQFVANNLNYLTRLSS